LVLKCLSYFNIGTNAVCNVNANEHVPAKCPISKLNNGTFEIPSLIKPLSIFVKNTYKMKNKNKYIAYTPYYVILFKTS